MRFEGVSTIDEYIRALPENRVETISTLRSIIRKICRMDMKRHLILE